MQQLKKFGLSGLAAIGAIALALSLGGSPALAAVKGSSLSKVSVSKPSATKPPTGSKAKNKGLTVKFDGPATSSSDYYIDYPKIAVAKKNKGVKSKHVYKPYFSIPFTPQNPAKSSKVTAKIDKYTTPGKYKIRIPVTEYNWNTGAINTKSGVTYLTVKANTKTSKQLTSFSGSGRAKKTFTVRVNAPDYQSGAKVTVYHKAPGKKKWKKVKTGKLKASNYSSKATLKISKKHNIAGKGGKVYVKVGGVSYAGGYKTKSAKVKKY